MKYKFTKKEINLLLAIKETLSDSNKVVMQDILNRVELINKTNEAKSKSASKRILEIRKEDKWYGRDNKTIQNHFNRVAKQIKKYLLLGKSKEARQLYFNMLEEAKLPRYEIQYNKAIVENLNENEFNFLKGL